MNCFQTLLQIQNSPLHLGRTHARDFLVVCCLLHMRSIWGGGGLAGIWWVLAIFQGLRICQHWVYLAFKKPFQGEDGTVVQFKV